jgi:hypothetical protein
MNFKAHGVMRSNPSFKNKVKMDPIQFDAKTEGSFDLEVGDLSLHIGEIGLRFAIPFMRPRGRLPMVATIGDFRIKTRPFSVRSKGIGVHVYGVVGKDKGLQGDIDVDVKCKTEMDVEGNVPVKVGRVQVDLCEADEMLD